MATYKVKAYGKEYTVEVIEQASGARIIVEGYSFEVEQASPGSVPGHTAARAAARTAAPAPAAAPAPVAAPPKKAAAPKAKAAAPAAPAKSAAPTGRGAVLAPIPGVITKVCVTEGEEVRAGQTVVKLEAMKMENDITALVAGTVKEVAVTEGAEVSDGQLLVLVV
ncbi:MAG TPA: biotin/lipoyl-containing protein [Candidatus Binatia bacterium]|jgi:glutaconyl-CoA decarboxylase